MTGLEMSRRALIAALPSLAFPVRSRARSGFALHALVDFIDDVQQGTFGPENVDALMASLQSMGADRVYWTFYGEGRFWEECPIWRSRSPVETKRLLGEPIRVAAAAAKRRGLEIFAYYKPYESGVSALLPEGSPEAKRYGVVSHLGAALPVTMRYVAEHPEQIGRAHV